MSESAESEAIELANKQYREYRQALWQHMASEHDLHLMDSEQDEIERLVLGPRNGERDALIAELNKTYRERDKLKATIKTMSEAHHAAFEAEKRRADAQCAAMSSLQVRTSAKGI